MNDFQLLVILKLVNKFTNQLVQYVRYIYILKNFHYLLLTFI